MFTIDKENLLTNEMIMKYIELHESRNFPRLEKLRRYYKGHQIIKERLMADTTKPNNRIVNAFPNYITDIMTGYFMGTPVAYSSDNEDAVQQINDLYRYNDEQSTNSILAKEASIYGRAYELCYIDKEANIRFKPIDAASGIPIFDNTLEAALVYFIRYYFVEDIISGESTRFVEVYDDQTIKLYRQESKALTLLSETPHAFNMVPVSIYKNNDDEIGDFELVMDLIDSYDKLASDSINDFEQFADAYLVLKGMSGSESEDVQTMKEQRILLLDSDNSSAEWLVKNVNDTYFQNVMSQFENNIHKFSSCPNLKDDAFAGTQSGVAVKYKLFSLETKCSIKEREFKKGLQRRIELISRIINIMGGAFSYYDITITFKRTMPSDLLEAADLVNKIYGIVSVETALEQLPFVDDVKTELQRLDKESNETLDFNAADHTDVIQ